MKELKQRFILRCVNDRDQLRAHQSGAPLTPESLRSIVHRMAGAAGIFGFADIGALAAALDETLACDGDASMLPQLIASLDEKIREHHA